MKEIKVVSTLLIGEELPEISPVQVEWEPE
jgi:hypothetical protein